MPTGFSPPAPASEPAGDRLLKAESRIQELEAMLESRRVSEEQHLQLANQAQAQVERFGRIYAVLCQVSRATASCGTRAEMLREVCRSLVETGRLRMAWVGWRQSDAQEIERAAEYGDTTGYLQRVRIFQDGRPEGRGPTGTSIREGILSICDDILTDDRMKPWREAAQEAGFRSSISLPIRQSGQVVGALVAYAGEAGYFGEFEVGLLGEAVRSIEHGLESIDREHQRRQAERALHANETEFRAIFETASVGMAQADPVTGRWLRVNQRMCLITGYSAAEMLQLRVRDLTHPEDRDRDSELFRRIVIGETQSYRLEKRYLRKDGSVSWVNVNVTVIRDMDGQPLRTTATIEDINERKRTERLAIQEAQRTELLLHLHQRAPQMTDRQLYEYVLDKALELTDSNSGFFHLFPRNPDPSSLPLWGEKFRTPGFENLPGGSQPPVYSGEILENLQRNQPVLVNAPEPETGTVVLPARHGRPERLLLIPTEVSDDWVFVLGVVNKPHGYADSDRTHLVLVTAELRKIVAQRSTQELLRKLSEAVAQSPVSVVITDIRGAIEYVNPMFTQTTGYSLEEVRGQNPRVLRSGEMSQEDYRSLWETILGGKAWHGEFHNRKKNGELYWESASISPIRDPMGLITHFVAVKEDITEFKLLEAQYRQAQKLEAIGQLAGGVAHDFNNILAVFMMQIGLLRASPSLDAETAIALEDLQAQAQRAASLTRQLLMFSRRSVLFVKAVDINAVVSNLHRMLVRLIGENFTLGLHPAEHLPSVDADPGMLEQVIMNLVVNARDAMPRGGTITLRTSVVHRTPGPPHPGPPPAPSDFVCLAVSDTGCGMDEATLKKIFEPFFTTKEAGRGTGLGLATVHGIVSQHRGWVEVDSKPGSGSVFRVFLPACASHGSGDFSAPAKNAAPQGSETILLVEDETSLRRLIGHVLRDLGYRVYEATNGREGLAAWEAHKDQIQLVLTDMVMPEGTTGLDLARSLRAREPGLRVIITSGYSVEIFREGLPVGEDFAYLPKPFDTETLARLIRRQLDGSE